MADCTPISTALAEARAAYHELMTGGAVSRFIDQNGESVSYSRAKVGELAGYISRLETDLALCQGNASAGYRGPLKFTYGRRMF